MFISEINIFTLCFSNAVIEFASMPIQSRTEGSHRLPHIFLFTEYAFCMVNDISVGAVPLGSVLDFLGMIPGIVFLWHQPFTFLTLSAYCGFPIMRAACNSFWRNQHIFLRMALLHCFWIFKFGKKSQRCTGNCHGQNTISAKLILYRVKIEEFIFL